MLRFISLALCAATIASTALAGDGKPCEPKAGKAPCKAGAKPAEKKAGKACDKKAAALAGRKTCAGGGHKECAAKASGGCKNEDCRADGHKKCAGEAAKYCEAKAKELAGGEAKKAGKCDGKGVDKGGDVPVAKKPAPEPCEKKEGGESKN